MFSRCSHSMFLQEPSYSAWALVVFYAALCSADFRSDYTQVSYTYLSLVSPPQFLSVALHALFAHNFRHSLYLDNLDVLPPGLWCFL